MRPTVVPVPPYSVMAPTPGGLAMLPTHVHHCSKMSNIYQTSTSHQSMETGNGLFKWATNHRIYFISLYNICAIFVSEFEGERYSSSGFVYSCPPSPTLPWARLTSHGSLLALDAMISGYTHLSNSRIQSTVDANLSTENANYFRCETWYGQRVLHVFITTWLQTSPQAKRHQPSLLIKPITSLFQLL